MTKSNAERQAAYRARHLKGEEGTGVRLNTVVDVSAKCSLERLAVRYGETQRQVLERLIKRAESSLLNKLPEDEQRAYFDKEKLG